MSLEGIGIRSVTLGIDVPWPDVRYAVVRGADASLQRPFFLRQVMRAALLGNPGTQGVELGAGAGAEQTDSRQRGGMAGLDACQQRRIPIQSLQEIQMPVLHQIQMHEPVPHALDIRRGERQPGHMNVAIVPVVVGRSEAGPVIARQNE